MFAGSFVLGLTLLGFAGWLHWNEIHGWPQEAAAEGRSELDRKYFEQRSKARKRIHLIIGGCGVLALIAAVAGPGPVWVACWMCVMIALMTVVILAALDALRTHRYQINKLPEIRREHFGDSD